MWPKFVRWLVFGVTFSLAPIADDYVSAIGRHGGSFPPIAEVLKHGELFILSSALAAVGLGEIIGANQKFQLVKIFIGGFSALNIFSSSELYSHANSPESANFIGYYTVVSYFIFAFTCIVSASCILISDIKDA